MTREEVEQRRIDNRLAPSGFRGRGIIDTGAEGSIITAKVVQALGIVPVRYATVLTTLGQARVAVYDVSIAVGPDQQNPPDPFPIRTYEGEVVACDMLIGRDILNRGELIWKGQEQRFSLALPRAVRSSDA